MKPIRREVDTKGEVQKRRRSVGREEGPEAKDEKKPGFMTKALMTAGIIVIGASGCTEKTVNNYNCPDAEARDTAEEVEDSGTEPDVPAEVPDVVADTAEDTEPDMADVVEEDADEEECVADRSPTSCYDPEPVAEGVLSSDNPLRAGNITLVLESTVEGIDTSGAVVSFVDECGEVVASEVFYTGSTRWIDIEGAQYWIVTDAVHHSESNPWASMSVIIRCMPGGFCSGALGTINQGETLAFGPYMARLDDINREAGEAILSILDGTTGAVLTSLVLGEGEHEYIFGYRLEVKQVASGVSFIAKWAELEVLEPCD